MNIGEMKGVFVCLFVLKTKNNLLRCLYSQKEKKKILSLYWSSAGA